MTETEIEKFFCTFISSMGLVAVRSRECKQAPVGTYYSVGVTSVDSAGTLHETATRDPLEPRQRVYQNVATLVVWEVEGERDGIRTLRNRIDTASFRAQAYEFGLSIWGMGSIMDMSTTDGPFWIRQKRMEITLAFTDVVDGEALPIESVEGSGTVNGYRDSFQHWTIINKE